MQAPSLHPRLQDTLDAFEASGVTLSAAEVCWLYSLRQPCDHPTDGSVPWVMGAPFEYAGVEWYPWHRLAATWFLRYFKLLDGEDHAQITLYLYAHAHSAPGDKSLRDLYGVERVRSVVSEWYDSLPLHDDQMEPLCNRLRELDGESDSIPDTDKRAKAETEPHADNGARFAAVMCKAFPGSTPEYWLTEISAGDARAMLDDMTSEGFATSENRREAIANYLKAVKWLWRKYTDG